MDFDHLNNYYIGKKQVKIGYANLLVFAGLLISLKKLIKPADNNTHLESKLNLLLLEKSILYLKNESGKNTVTDQAIKEMISKLETERAQTINEYKLDLKDHLQSPQIYFNLELQLVEHQRRELIKSYQNSEFSLEIIKKKECELDFWMTTIEHEIEQYN